MFVWRVATNFMEQDSMWIYECPRCRRTRETTAAKKHHCSCGKSIPRRIMEWFDV